MPRFPYTCALITGASSGIGLSMARELSRLGVTTILVARSKDRLEEIATRLGSTSPAIALPMDLTSPSAVDHLFAEISRRRLHVDLLINNAGFGSYGFFHETSIDSQLHMIDLNIKSIVQLTHRLLPPMIERRVGAIVNVSSTSSFQPIPFMAVYAATKSFVTSFSLALAAELQASGVRVLASCPGRTKTNFQMVAGSHVVRIRSRSASADDVARVTLRALQSRRLFIIEGWINKLSIHVQRFFPRRLVLKVAHKLFEPQLHLNPERRT